MAPANSLFQRMASGSHNASGRVKARAAPNCTVLAVRTSQGATKRFWYSVPAVMPSNAATAKDRFSQVAWSPGPPLPNLRETTSTSPIKPSTSPNHWRRDTLPCPPLGATVADSHTAVSTGCSPTTSADRPEPMPALTAAHTPPRYTACISTPVTARWPHWAPPLGQRTLAHTIQGKKQAMDSA